MQKYGWHYDLPMSASGKKLMSSFVHSPSYSKGPSNGSSPRVGKQNNVKYMDGDIANAHDPVEDSIQMLRLRSQYYVDQGEGEVSQQL